MTPSDLQPSQKCFKPSFLLAKIVFCSRDPHLFSDGHPHQSPYQALSLSFFPPAGHAWLWEETRTSGGRQGPLCGGFCPDFPLRARPRLLRVGDWLRASPGGSCSRAQGRGLAPAPDGAARSSHLFFRRSWERGRRREAPGGGDAARLCRSPSRCRAARTALPRSLSRLLPPSGEFSRLRCCNFSPAEAAPRLAARTHASARRGAGGC